jgi:very-short-patch-repair endonuclease
MRGPRPHRTRRARALRAHATSAEDILWGELRARRLGGFKFVRQSPVDPYVVDFLCREHRLVVEVDGATHGEPHEITSDQVRTRHLERMGYRVYRAWNGDIFDNIDGVLDELLALLEGRLNWRSMQE